MTHKDAAENLLKLCDVWTERGVEAVVALAEAGEPPELIRIAIAFTGGSMVGQMLSLNVPLDACNAAGTRYFVACDEAMCKCLPGYESNGPWPTTLN